MSVLRADLPLNTIADNTIDTMNEVGGIHAESFISADSGGTEGEAVLTLNSSIVASNDGVGFGGPSPGLPGYVSPGGGDNFSVVMTYTDLHGNEAGDLDSWIPSGLPGNIFEDPLLTPLTYLVERCSPTIDAGDPAFAYDNEPGPNGDRVNMGSTGNTSDATTSIADVSGDGIQNGGKQASKESKNALKVIDTINGLPIGSDLALATWYANNVVGGTDAFLLPALSFSDF